MKPGLPLTSTLLLATPACSLLLFGGDQLAGYQDGDGGGTTRGGGGEVRIFAGETHACAWRAGVLKCWGHNPYGQTGVGVEDHSEVRAPGLVLLDPRAAKVFAGGQATCAILEDDQLQCWGYGEDGQLGHGDYQSAIVPQGTTFVGLGRVATSVAIGAKHTCAILDDDTLECWGLNEDGQLGYGGRRLERPPGIPVLTHVRGAAAGSWHTCAISGPGELRCWGRNDHTQCGDASRQNVIRPGAIVPLPRPVSEVAAGLGHTCAIFGDRTAACWGDNGDGQLGTGAWRRGDPAVHAADLPAPIDFGMGRTVSRIAAGARHTCAILEDGTLTCWGANDRGQLGYGDTEARADPSLASVDLGPGHLATGVAAGTAFTCAALDDGTAKCWGDPRIFGAPREDPALRPPADPIDLDTP